MKLTASLLVADGELSDRYLRLTVPALLEFVDEVRLVDDGARDGVGEWAEQHPRVWVRRNPEPRFYLHEARARNELIAWTLAGDPDWVLAVDCDELVSDGPLVRRACESTRAAVLTCCMWEVWNARADRLELRQDGGWAERDAAVLWAPGRLSGPPTVADRALACGRVPEALRGAPTACSGAAVLHLGWARRAERAARHGRYVQHDGGRFHASRHLDSILAPDEQVALTRAGWPATLLPWRDRLVERAARP